MAGDANYDKVSLLLHCNGANGATTLPDNSLTPKTPTFFGNAQISTAQSVFGGASLLLDGNGDYVAFPDHNDFDLGGLDFFFESRIRLTSFGPDYGGSSVACVVGKDLAGDRSFNWILAGPTGSYTTFYFDGYDASNALIRASVPFTPALNTWYSIAAGRSGNLIYFFIGGTLQNPGGTAFVGSLRNSTQTVKVGACLYGVGAEYYFPGYIDELRITKGVCRHTSTYTLETAPFQDGQGQISGTVTDAAGSPASRIVRAYRRDTGALVGSATSDGTTGAYSFYTPTLDEVDVICQDSATGGTYYNDLRERVIPA